MSKALYRKYRSKNFDEVMGQEHITHTLKSALEQGSISHAYLFTGPRGVGKTSIARILAHAINDLEYSDESSHLDIIEIDAASNRRIDEIRDLRDKVHIAPTSAKFKVYIIDEVHMLTREAFNALLKTLEEPPEHAIFILATTEIHKVPDTIISRTQRYTFRPISEDDAVKHLRSIAEKEDLHISDEALKLLARHGRGSFRDSISMLDQTSGLGKKSITESDVELLLGVPSESNINDLIQSLTENDSTKLFASIARMREHGIDSGRAANSIAATLRDAIINKRLVLPEQKIIALLKRLLDLSSGSHDYIGLEIAFLEQMQPERPVTQHSVTTTTTTEPNEPQPDKPAANTHTATQHAADTPPTNDHESIEPEPAATAVVEPEPEESSEEDGAPEQATNQQTTPTHVEFDKHSWEEMLNDLKKKHNTLYGVLRMAHASEENGKICLDFKFGFHKKQIESPRNMTIVREYTLTHFGASEIVTTLSDKAAQKKPTKIEPPKENGSNEAISNVSNIFGGAELLE